MKMRNLIVNIYCSRDRNTQSCPMHKCNGLPSDKVIACVQCDRCIIEFTAPGRALSERGLPRLTPGMNLKNFEE